MKVFLELQSDVWPQSLEKVEKLGFVSDGAPLKACPATVLISGSLPEDKYEECSAIPGVVGIWEDIQFSTFDPSSLK